MAPVVLGQVLVMFLVGMADMGRLAGCCGGPRRMEVQDQEHLAWVRYLLDRVAPVAAGILFVAGKADNDLSATGWDWELRALFIVGVNLSFTTSLLAFSALTLEVSCDCVIRWLAVTVMLAAVHLVAAWAVRGRLRALRLRRAS